MHPADWSVRPGTLVDVPGVVRLAMDDALGADAVVDEGALRLLLTHVVLEQGRLWVAERGCRLVGASIWLPASAEHLANDLRRIAARELGGARTEALTPDKDVDDQLQLLLPDVLRLVERSAPRLVLLNVAIAPGLSAGRRERLVTDLVRAMQDEPIEGRLLAVSFDPDHVRVLVRAGFETLGGVPVGNHSLWIGHAGSPRLWIA